MIDVAILIADLIEAGTPAELVGRVAQAVTEAVTEGVTRDAISASSPNAHAVRQRRYRERQRASSRVTLGDVTGDVTGVTPPSPPPAPSPDKETPPLHPPKENNLFPEPPPQPRVSGAHEFERFWAMFPNKVGKADAVKAFAKAIKRVDVETMIAGLDRYVHKTDDRPWCNPSTWLNQDRWTDQPAPGARAGPHRGSTGPKGLEWFDAAKDYLDEQGRTERGAGSDQADDRGQVQLAIGHRS